MTAELASWRKGSRSIVPIGDPEELDSDPRGILFLYEQPRNAATYVISLDPTVGKTGWNRYARVDDDLRIDNATIEILRKGTSGSPDVQVAEYAAPIDAIELAPIADALGRLYSGDAEDGQALMTGDAVGPGAVTLRELIDRYQYTNHFTWRYYGSAAVSRPAARGNVIWWQSSRSANKDLWMRGLHHIHKGHFTPYSEHLVEEMTDCMADSYTLIGEARHGRHDDRIKAVLYGIWALHDWATSEEGVDNSPVVSMQPKNLQAMDVDYDGMIDAWEEQVGAILDS